MNLSSFASKHFRRSVSYEVLNFHKRIDKVNGTGLLHNIIEKGLDFRQKGIKILFPSLL